MQKSSVPTQPEAKPEDKRATPDQEQHNVATHLQEIKGRLTVIENRLAVIENRLQKAHKTSRGNFVFAVGLTGMAAGMGLVTGGRFVREGVIIFALGLVLGLISVFLL
jgi:hypothetical protein